LSSGLVLVIDRRSKGRMMILGAGRFALTAGIEDTEVRTWNSWGVLLNCHSLYIDGTSKKCPTLDRLTIGRAMHGL